MILKDSQCIFVRASIPPTFQIKSKMTTRSSGNKTLRQKDGLILHLFLLNRIRISLTICHFSTRKKKRFKMGKKIHSIAFIIIYKECLTINSRLICKSLKVIISISFKIKILIIKYSLIKFRLKRITMLNFHKVVEKIYKIKTIFLTNNIKNFKIKIYLILKKLRATTAIKILKMTLIKI